MKNYRQTRLSSSQFLAIFFFQRKQAIYLLSFFLAILFNTRTTRKIRPIAKARRPQAKNPNFTASDADIATADLT